MKVIIIGAGGHSRVIADALLSRNQIGDNNEIVGLLDDNENLKDQERFGRRILGRISDIDKYEHEAIVIGIGDNLTRKNIYAKFKEQGKKLLTVIHPHATIAQDVVIGDGTVIFAGVIINSGARIDSNVILNTSCTVGHDVVLCPHTQIGPGANLGGGVTVGEGAFICIGSSIIQQKKIGEWAIVGAGAAVIHDVPAFKTVVGVPAVSLLERTSEKNKTLKT
jgi:acetyltransferase EpsM